MWTGSSASDHLLTCRGGKRLFCKHRKRIACATLPDCRAGSRSQISRAGHRLVAGGVIGFGLARRGDILGAGFLQDLLGSPGPVTVVGMNREQHAAALDASLIALG